MGRGERGGGRGEGGEGRGRGRGEGEREGGWGRGRSGWKVDGGGEGVEEKGRLLEYDNDLLDRERNIAR
jgi:hypothetical protein